MLTHHICLWLAIVVYAIQGSVWCCRWTCEA